MRTRAAWLVTLPIALVGVEAAHALANRLFGSPEGSGELFASGRTGAGLLPGLVALGVGLVLVGLGARVAGARGSSSRRRAAPFAMALLPLVAFAVLELLEGVLHRGAVPWGELLEPTFLVGLVLQLPFAAAGYLVARLLMRAGDALRALIARRRSTPRRTICAGSVRRPPADRPRPAPARTACRGRAPPGLLASG